MRFPSLLRSPDTAILSSKWLDLLSRSGTPFFVSIDPESLGHAQKIELRKALGRAAVQSAFAEPLDWMDTTCPSQWRFGEERVDYDWFLDWS